MRPRLYYRPLIITAWLGLGAVGPADAEPVVQPYLEVGQVVTADLRDGGDVLTYSMVAAGVDVSRTGPRSDMQLNYRYEHRFGWGQRLNQSGIHSGVMRGRYDLVPSHLSIDAGALATRTRTRFSGAAPATLLRDADNVSQLYVVYAGPVARANMGELNVETAYRAGYVRADAATRAGGALAPAPEDEYGASVTQSAMAQLGMAPGALPFGWSVRGDAIRDDQNHYDQRFGHQQIRGDLTLPISATVALVGGIGYENIRTTQRPLVTDDQGHAVRDAHGQTRVDATAPRTLTYDFDGLYWDTGVSWRPSAATEVEARIGHRFSGVSYRALVRSRLSASTGFQAEIYDDVETLGQQVTGGVARLPTRFAARRSGFSGFGDACAFGTAGDGGCLNAALSGLTTGSYRNRGLALIWTRDHGRLTTGLGAGFNRRSLLHLPEIAANPAQDSWYGQLTLDYAAARHTRLSSDLTVSIYDLGGDIAPTIYSGSWTGAIRHQLSRHLDANAALGVAAARSAGDTDILATASAGVRYSF